VDSDGQILGAVKSGADTIHHAAGTCQMGKAENPMAVVDPNGSFPSPVGDTETFLLMAFCS
jgi:choline dehydrogenase-like flavoprotein